MYRREEKETMATLQTLMAAIGVGAAHLTLTLDESIHPRGSTIHGKLDLKGGNVEQRIETLSVLLVKHVEHGKAVTDQACGTVLLDSAFAIHPTEEISYAFQFAVPDDVAVNGIAQGAFVAVEADVLRAFNPRATVMLNVVPHREVGALQTALGELGFEAKSGFPDASGVNSIVHYSVPESLNEQLDEVSLHLKVEDSIVIGMLVINPREHNLTERLVNLVDGNNRHICFEIPSRELLDEHGEPNVAEAVSRLKEMLDQSVALPDNEKQWMLRSSVAPPHAGHDLLRAADHAGETPAEQLLRAHDADHHGAC